ncbi:chemotaxis protein CheX [Magnetofaba australis]|uniref:Chemotaxis phosphatase CheX-like domain-containing protein n=1 Tax=Magnetofaba australis IT-1 TaxID=1434232 RepID=A0A1Y2K7J1_9PROT|nr:chemotaxis protein CheX [Magnetofaba australis]OSM06279.1 hypothetical protein MAIT1_01266 [Magnetofaba australis IT-1]
MSETTDKLINALRGAVNEVMGTMAWCEAIAAGEKVVNSLILDDEVGGMIHVGGDVSAMVGISCNKRIAAELCSRIVGLPAEELNDEDLLDGVAELANMICGAMKSKAAVGHLDLSSPAAIVGQQFQAQWKTLHKTHILAFELEGERFCVHLSA